MTTKEFAKILQDKLTSEYGVDLSVASNQQIYRSLALICRQLMSENHKKFQSKAIGTGSKQVYYLCMDQIARNAATKMYDPDALKPFPKMMISEDFAYFMEKVPAVFGLVGSQNKELGFTAKNHNDHYTVDESVLKRGAAMYAQFAYDFLEEKSK